MKYLYTALLLTLFVSCSSDDEPLQTDYTAQNEQEILNYIEAYGLDATRTNSGLYYVIDEVGFGSEIHASSDVSVRYLGSFLNGTVFDQNLDEGISLNLQQNIIPGWREGLQYFNEGGSGTLLIPSHLAYGNREYNDIPAGSVLVFEIELIDYEEENEQEIVDYIADNNLDAIQSGTGLYYVINEEGTGEQPTASSNVTVAYKGYFTDGEVFNESDVNGAVFDLSNEIPGWTEGIQYFKEGGDGVLLVPSSLAYGRYGIFDPEEEIQVIPYGAVLIFDVNLKSVN
jgi:FKBP-type peptidyl-prolyl cis-trans isomerase